MVKISKNELVKQVNWSAGEYAISTVLFRHAAGGFLGINVTDMACLTLIFSKGLAAPSDLARYTGLTSGATTAMLDRLEKAHLIERRRNPQDRRGTLIVLTNERTKEIGDMFASGREEIDKLAMSCTESELELIADYFSKLVVIWTEEREKLQQKIKAEK
jgi:DNA-binding MarR family transcriptional regulator